MLHSQARSAPFRKRSRYWYIKHDKLARESMHPLIHRGFHELSPIQEEPEATPTPTPYSYPPPITVGRVTTRSPGTTIDRRLPPNTFYRRKDGKVTLGSKSVDSMWTFKYEAPDSFRKVKVKANVFDTGVIRFGKESLGGGTDVRAKARQMIRSKSDENILAMKAIQEKIMARKNTKRKDPYVSKHEKMHKTSRSTISDTADDNRVALNTGGYDIVNRPPLVRSDDSEQHNFQEWPKKQKKKKPKKAKRTSGDSSTSKTSQNSKVLETSADGYNMLSSPCADRPLIGKRGVVVTDYGPPNSPVCITADRHARDWDPKTQKLKNKRNQMPRSLRFAVAITKKTFGGSTTVLLGTWRMRRRRTCSSMKVNEGSTIYESSSTVAGNMIIPRGRCS